MLRGRETASLPPIMSIKKPQHDDKHEERLDENGAIPFCMNQTRISGGENVVVNYGVSGVIAMYECMPYWLYLK